MIKTSASQLKAKLGQYMRAVRAGKEVLITDRDVPVARLIPSAREKPLEQKLRSGFSRDPASPPLGRVRVRSIQYHGRSTTDLLREDRNRR